MKNKITELYLVSLLILAMGFFEIIFNYTKASITEEFCFGIIKLLVGTIFLIFTIVYQVKYNTNRKQLERESSKEYDERDDLIQGKVSQLTMRILIPLIFIIMFLSNWITISANTALFIIIIFSIITDILAKKYYSHFL